MVQLINIASGNGEPRSNAIFVHGLGGDLYGTWQGGDDPKSFWPRWLAEDIKSLAVYLVGYEASVSRWRGSAMHLTDRATSILARLLAEPALRKGSLILIGHSLGGLVIKQMLRTAESEARHRTDVADLMTRVEKVAFLATPHMGADLAILGDRLRILVRPSAATICLVRNDPNLRDLNLWYRDWANARSISHLVLTETKPLRVLGMMVKPDSADPGLVGGRPISIGGDHWSMCKPDDRKSDTYVQMVAFIERAIERPGLPGEGKLDTLSEGQKVLMQQTETMLGLLKREKPRPREIFHGVPPRIASFTGRTEELELLDAILSHEKPAAVTQTVGRAAVQGLGGVGKTSLAIEYAHRSRSLYAGVCWCPAETRVGLLSALASLAVTLGAATAEETNVEKAAKAALGRLSEQRAPWLLVYDNVSSPDELTDLLPSAGARLLITSRFSDWSGWAEEVALDVLPLQEAVGLLQSRTGRSDAAGAKLLAEALDRLPLALDHAAAYCKRTQTHFADYAAKASSLIAAAPRGVGYPRSVAATFDLAITQAVAHCPAAEPLMAYLAQCAPERIPMILVEGALDDERERLEALTSLVELSLLRHDPFQDGTQAVTLHRLVQAATQTKLAERYGEAALVKLVTLQLAKVFPKNGYEDPTTQARCAALLAHVSAIRQRPGWRKTQKKQAAKLLTSAGAYLYRRATTGRTGEELTSIFGPYVVDWNRVVKHFSGEAETFLREALALSEQAFGPKHPNTVSAVKNLACLLQDQGDLAEARPLLERTLSNREETLGPDHPDTVEFLLRLANLLQQRGEFAGARPLYERALAIREKALGPEHFDTVKTVRDLGWLLQQQGDFAGARPLYERALAIHETAFGRERAKKWPYEEPSDAEALAELLKAQGDLAGARPLYERALAIYDNLGASVPTLMVSLAHLLSDTGRGNEAEPLFRKAIAIAEDIEPQSPPSFYEKHYALFLLQTDRAAEALSVAQTALWPAPGSEDTELGVLMELEVGHGETEVYAGVQA